MHQSHTPDQLLEYTKAGVQGQALVFDLFKCVGQWHARAKFHHEVHLGELVNHLEQSHYGRVS